MSDASYIRQPKTEQSTSAIEVTKPSQNVTRTKSLPLWTKAWGDGVPPGLSLGGSVQAKRPGSHSKDAAEQKADQVAEQIMPISSCPVQIQPSAAGLSETSRVPSNVHEVISSPGQPLDSATRSFMEPRFEHDFSEVRIHTDVQAAASAQSINAQAYTVDHDIVFGPGQYAPATTAGNRLLAHELTHVVQQGMARTQQSAAAPLELAVSATNDPMEIEANRTMEQVMQNKSAAINGVAQRRTGAAIRRFVSTEHKVIGDVASGNKITDLNIGTAAQPEYLTYGDVVALAGDYFESPEQIRDLASGKEGQNGRDQLRWARWYAYGSGPGEPSVDETSVKKVVKNQYFRQAAVNITHFSAGGTARNEYEKYHLQALQLAFDSGAREAPTLWDIALATEAFSNHFLTDMFSAGHVRTERRAIKEWHKQHFQNSKTQFVDYMALIIWIGVQEQHQLLGVFKSKEAIKKKIEDIGGDALDAFTLGDIVSLAMHNADSKGLNVVFDVDIKGRAGKFPFTAMGDEKLNLSLTTPDMTRDMAIAAVRASLKDLDTMKNAGKAASKSRVIKGGQNPQQVAYQKALERLKTSTTSFVSERFIPREDKAKGNVRMDWKWGQFNKAMRDATDEAVKGSIANELNRIIGSLKEKQEREAMGYFVQHLREKGIRAIELAIGTNAGG